MAFIATVASGVRGAGKSTTALNLGVALNNLGKNVTIIDANLSTPYLSMYLGAPRVPVTLHHVLSGSAQLHEALYLHSSGTKVIPGCISSQQGFDKLRVGELQHHLQTLRGDVILLDAATGYDGEAKAALHASHGVLLACPPNYQSVLATKRLITKLEKDQIPITGVILTGTGTQTDMTKNDIESLLGHSVIDMIPKDPLMKQALFQREAITEAFPQSPAAEAYRRLAASLLDNGHHLRSQRKTKKEPYRLLKWMLGVKR